ncbi:hypothetical protein FSP39_008548 [Pinctada imbricata]|uniref:carbonic anhydrase n=1 Tax=Pinctada imbricata TaxID=66713 RepID=A0AA88YCD2_PINIB|nr:hypothetical protein FSP39_008548 [Pinctada imbricata]
MTKTHKGVFINNGHAPTFQLSDTGSIMTGLPCFRREKFRLHQFHFHFRHGEHDGTEHEMEGVKYAAELHMVHYNVKYGSFVKAVDKYDGLAVVAVLMEVILNHGTHCSFNPFDIVPKYHNFFYYKGSLTTPGCYQSVHWLIFKEKIFIKPETLKVFRDMRTKHGEPISKRGNIRPVQPLFMRHLLINFFPKKPKKEFSTYPCMDLRATTEFKLDFPYV